ncbi:MAG: hypothetical protein Q8M19_10475 [Reyranella sp.]|nr:hypothetical protein [Reyranella sp.]
MQPASSTIALILGATMALPLVVAGCAQVGLPVGSPLSTPIAPSEVEWARKSGANTVSGNAALKAPGPAGGASHTCAGQSANLIPDTAYARARMTAIFGNDSRGTRAASLGPVKFERDDPLYVSTLRTTRCDTSGSFAFARVPDGVWYVTTSVKWQAPVQVAGTPVAGAQAAGTPVGASAGGQIEGGSMMRRVEVRGGRLVKVTLP